MGKIGRKDKKEKEKNRRINVKKQKKKRKYKKEGKQIERNGLLLKWIKWTMKMGRKYLQKERK